MSTSTTSATTTTTEKHVDEVTGAVTSVTTIQNVITTVTTFQDKHETKRPRKQHVKLTRQVEGVSGGGAADGLMSIVARGDAPGPA